MKRKRVLFVDDDPFVLQGMQRLLHSMRGEWEMEFIDKSSVALERMSRSPFDVVVSDMQMPVMNGAELLNEVRIRHPRTVRLILSGHANRDLIFRSIGCAHQYLSKPCNAEVLKYTVARATALEPVFENPGLIAVVARIETMPSLPGIYTELMARLQSSDVSMTEVGAIIEKDIAMTAKILKMVNSAFFGLAREVSSAADAASFLGADVLKVLLLSAHLFARYEKDHGSCAFAEGLWAHSLRTALAAKAIAQAEQRELNVVSEAFAAGMLHDVGKLVLATSFPAEYRRVLTRMESAHLLAREAELEVFGATHAEVGGYLLGLWGLPVPIVEAVALHHVPEAGLRRDFSALTAVHVANCLVKSPDESAPLDLERVEAQGLTGHIELWQNAVNNSLAYAG